MRQYDRAIETELRCIRRNPKIFWSHVILGWAYQQKGMHREALAELQEGVKLTKGMPFTLAAFGQALAAAGDSRGAENVLSQLHERARSVYVSAYDIALIHAALGDKDAAFRWLDTARQERSSFLPYVTWDRRADVLRSDPRFDQLLQQLGFRSGPAVRTSR